VVSKNDYKILYLFFEQGCTNEMKSMTVDKISTETNLSVSKVRKSIKVFKELLYISEGIPQGNAKTYYITKDGYKKVELLLEVSI
jgi:DNA-binding transcriptional regulator GbsR (MarR family)